MRSSTEKTVTTKKHNRNIAIEKTQENTKINKSSRKEKRRQERRDETFWKIPTHV
jgi:hypothetical protein